MNTPLWPHQQEAVEKLAPLGRGALWMEMGDGKTRTALELVARWGCRRVLILCPLKVVRVWPDEFRKHIGNEWLVVDLDSGTVKQRAEFLRTAALMATCDEKPFAAALNYDALVHAPLPETLSRLPWDCLICDESHRLKQHDGVQARTVAQPSQRIPHRLLLTGTPMPHSQLDVFAQWRILAPEVFGPDWWHFQRRYARMEQREVYARGSKGKPVKRRVWTIAKHPETQQPWYTNTADLQARVAPLVYRSSGAIQLPDTVDQQVYCLLDPGTQRVYNSVADDLRAEFDAGTITASNALTRVLRLAQIANGFATDDTGQLVPLGTEKADLLGEVLADLSPEEPVVVFGRFVQDLASIARVARAQGRAYHEVSGRRNDLAAWQGGDGNVLGVQLQAGGVGVDLTRARYQVYLSLDFSLGNYLQTRKRIHRPGQTRNVTYIHLLAAGTVDETILTALQQRRDVVTAIVDGLGRDTTTTPQHEERTHAPAVAS